MIKRERMYVYTIILLLIALFIKSFYFDEVQGLNNDEKLFKEYVEKIVDESYQGFLKDYNIIGYRVVKIEKVDTEGISLIKVKDGNYDKYKEVEINGKYRAKVRKYLFYLIPFGEDRVLSRK